MKIAIVGSRDYPHLDDVRALVRRIASDHPDALIFSGGAKGVDKKAENTAMDAGLRVYSYRVRQLDSIGESFGIEEWGFGAQKPWTRLMLEEPTWADYNSALAYRNALIGEYADRVVAFHDGFSRGTSLAMDFAHAFGDKVTVYGVTDDERYVA